MSSRGPGAPRPEQGWSLVLALCACVPHVLALASVRGWLGHDEAVMNESSSLYIVSLPFAFVLGAWAFARAARTVRVGALAAPPERALAVAALALGAVAMVPSVLVFLAAGLYLLQGGGR